VLSRCVIEFLPAVEAAPADVREEARARFEEITEGLEGIPKTSPFRDSVRISRLCLVVRGWSFFYNIDSETLRISEVRPKK
jgi:hypothetical protein